MSSIQRLSSSSPVAPRARSIMLFAPFILSITAFLIFGSKSEADIISAISVRGSLRFSPTFAKKVVLACSAFSAACLALRVASKSMTLLIALETVLRISSHTCPFITEGFISRYPILSVSVHKGATTHVPLSKSLFFPSGTRSDPGNICPFSTK